jgi:hypothetical protein
VEEVVAPDRGGAAVAGLQDDGGAARAPALEIEPTAADVDEAGDVPLCRGERRRRWTWGSMSLRRWPLGSDQNARAARR